VAFWVAVLVRGLLGSCMVRGLVRGLLGK
jgi:hypothetical protein